MKKDKWSSRKMIYDLGIEETADIIHRFVVFDVWIANSLLSRSTDYCLRLTVSRNLTFFLKYVFSYFKKVVNSKKLWVQLLFQFCLSASSVIDLFLWYFFLVQVLSKTQTPSNFIWLLSFWVSLWSSTNSWPPFIALASLCLSTILFILYSFPDWKTTQITCLSQQAPCKNRCFFVLPSSCHLLVYLWQMVEVKYVVWTKFNSTQGNYDICQLKVF